MKYAFASTEKGKKIQVFSNMKVNVLFPFKSIFFLVIESDFALVVYRVLLELHETN